ncbi:neuropeptide Y receptor type 2-like [Stylophora pistillata]|uniref:neuropeptide Y receptor type 2-like n=1 Tax=Stylophora pistillata TaxID=50429 RepID=UPI000C051FA8|nr:neuropeptide Y receptor type 2-like [Stylophora pistillata]
MNSVGNETTEIELLYFKEPHWLEILRLTFEFFIAALGIAGNTIVCLVITFQPQMQTVINFYIRNLAIADLVILLFSFPLTIIKEQDPHHWPLGEFFCRFLYPLNDVFFGVSVWSITLVAIDRYRAIVGGRVPKRNSYNFSSARWMILGVWIISFLIISLPLYFVMRFIDDNSYIDCTPDWPNAKRGNLGEMRQIYNVAIIVFWYVLPLAIIAGTFRSISVKLRASTNFNRSIQEECNEASKPHSARKRLREQQNSKAKKLLIPVVIVFAVTMLPVNVFRLVVMYWEGFSEHKYLWVFYNVCVIFVIANSSANFFIYSLVSDEFRHSFKRLFCRDSNFISRSTTDRTVRSPLHSP